jgi:hypothetical protein
MPTTTTNLGLTLPTPDVDTGWGTTLNSDFTLIDNLFAANGTGTSVGIQVGSGKKLVMSGTLIFGDNDGTGSASAATAIRGTAKTGTNVTGPNLVIQASNGTGTGGSGAIRFQTAPADVSGTTAGTMRNVLTIDNEGNITANVGSFLGPNGVPVGANVAGVNAQTGTTYTLVLSDAGKLVSMNNSASNTLTVPLNASVAFSIGTVVNIVSLGVGQTTIAAASGVTIYSYGSKTKLTGRYSQAALIKRTTDSWVLAGDLIA